MSENGNRAGRPVDHGIRQLEEQWRRGELAPATVDSLRELMRDGAEGFGGMEGLSMRELWLLEDAAFAKFITRQIFDFVVRRGSIFVDPEKGELHPVLAKSAATWLNTTRLDLLALGLRPERIDHVLARCHWCAAGFRDEPSYRAHFSDCPQRRAHDAQTSPASSSPSAETEVIPSAVAAGSPAPPIEDTTD